MAVKVNNIENVRKAKRWSEADDAALCILLKKKIKETNVSIRESETPYERARLKARRNQYKSMLRKVEEGGYNGDIIFSELRAANALRGEQVARMNEYDTVAGAKKYNNAYTDVDFDYESAFRKKRYYGVALPILLLLFSIIFVGIFIMGPFLPDIINDIAVENGISLKSFFAYRIGTGTLDIAIPNDGKWPDGTFKDGVIPPKQGEPYEDQYTNIPDTVKLSGDLGMTSIYITPYDIVKAWFRTPMLEKTRIDFLEDSPYFQGSSYYYLCFLSGAKAEALEIKKNEDGNYDFSVIIRYIGTYGAIYFIIVTFLLGVVNIIVNICRIFSYTSRKIHILSLLCFLFSALSMIAPALAMIEGTDIGAAFSAYFSLLTNSAGFFESTETTVGVQLLYFVPAAISLLMMLLPRLFRNRLKKRPTYVPKGNKSRDAYDDPYIITEETLRNIR